MGETYGTAGNGPAARTAANTIVYRLGAADVLQATSRTFTQRGAAFRAPGHPQGSFAPREAMIDLFAHAGSGWTRSTCG